MCQVYYKASRNMPDDGEVQSTGWFVVQTKCVKHSGLWARRMAV